MFATKAKEPQLKEIVSTQSFSPIKDIRDGVICTKDGRYVKILEFNPVNFSLRSADEQAIIVYQFSMALRAMPSNVQFKILTRKADVSRFLRILLEHYEQESNEACRRLQEEQMTLIHNIGMETGVTRRFFLIFEHEAEAIFHKRQSFEEISLSINQTANMIIGAMEACGNECISPERNDSWVLSALYEIMCRSEAETVSYNEHELSVVAPYMTKEGFDYSQGYTLNINNLITPYRIDDRKSFKYLEVQSTENEPPLYYTFAYIPGDSYPRNCVAGWINMLINIGEGVDVDIFVHRENPEMVSRKLTYLLRSKKSTARHADDTSTDYDELINTIDSGYYIKRGLANNEDFCYFGCILTITAHTVDTLEAYYKEIRQHVIRHDMNLRRCNFQMKDAFLMTLPLVQPNKAIFGKAKRNVLGSQVASVYPFISYEMSDENGILLGTQDNGSLVLLDNFDTRKYPNANICIMGSTGAGKTYLLQCMALRYREKQNQVFVILPEKGHEFKPITTAIGGQFITIAPGSPQNINLMEIRKKDDSNDLLLNGLEYEEPSILTGKIQSIETFFSLLMPQITYEEKQYLDEALIKTYGNFGITVDNNSLADPNHPYRYKQMPIFGDLDSELEKLGPETKRLRNVLARFVTGSAASFNQPTNVDLDNKYVVLDVSRLTDEMLPVGMFIALDYVWDKAREDRTAKKVIIMDEAWKLIGPAGSDQAAKFVLDVFKLIRGYGGAGIIATQDLNDFLSAADGKFGKGIINNSKTKIVMRVEKREAEALQDSMDLTDAETTKLQQLERGTGLLIANANHVFVHVQASPTEHDFITTDRNDLARIAAQRKAQNATQQMK